MKYFFVFYEYLNFVFRNVGYEEFPRSSVGKIQVDMNEDIDKSIDKQLLSPSDPEVDVKGLKKKIHVIVLLFII